MRLSQVVAGVSTPDFVTFRTVHNDCSVSFLILFFKGSVSGGFVPMVTRAYILALLVNADFIFSGVNTLAHS